MSDAPGEHDELRIMIGRLRAMLEGLIVRGLRACGDEELRQLSGYADELDKMGAGHVASVLSTLHAQAVAGDRAAARTLLNAQTAVRLLERLLTLRIATAILQSAAAHEDGE